MAKRITILGAGNGGFALSVHLTLRGFNVALYEEPKFKQNIEPVKENGGIEAFGDISGFAKLQTVSTNIEEVIKNANIIMVAVPSFAQEIMIEKTIPYLEKGQIILLNPDNTGTIKTYQLLKENGLEKDVILAGTTSLLYAAKKLSPVQVEIAAVKHKLQFSAMPAQNTKKLLPILKELYPGFIAVENVLATSLGNFNHQLHTAPLILNAGRVESNQEFKFYWDGHTKSINNVVENMDQEKLKIAEVFGIKLTPIKKLMEMYYSGRYKKQAANLNEMITTNLAYKSITAPNSLTSRYIIEDLKYGLVLISSIGEKYGIATPTIDAVIHMASVLNKVNYKKEGTTLEKLGLDKLSKTEILTYLQDGSK